MKAFKSMILTAFLVLLGILSGCSPDEKRPVVFADPGWDSVRFHNAVAQLVAEKVYGLKTEILYGSTPITQAALVRGDADVNMELWTDNVPTYEADKAAGGIVDLGVNYDDNRQGFYVPRYVIEGDAERGIAPMAPDLKSVKDLRKIPRKDAYMVPSQDGISMPSSIRSMKSMGLIRTISIFGLAAKLRFLRLF